MNYKTELNGWAVEMAIKAVAAGVPISQILDITTQLVTYAYTSRKDLEATAKDLFDLVREAEPDRSAIDSIMVTLERIKYERVEAGLDKADNEVTN